MQNFSWLSVKNDQRCPARQHSSRHLFCQLPAERIPGTRHGFLREITPCNRRTGQRSIQSDDKPAAVFCASAISGSHWHHALLSYAYGRTVKAKGGVPQNEEIFPLTAHHFYDSRKVMRKLHENTICASHYFTIAEHRHAAFSGRCTCQGHRQSYSR